MASRAPLPANRAPGYLVIALMAVFIVMLAWPYTPFGQRGASAGTALAEAPANAPLATLELESGTVVIRLRPDLAPNHVTRITELANAGFYDGVKFHRVIAGFMAQTGDPLGTGAGRSHLPNLGAEFTDTDFVRGTLGMARGASPDSANSQFFIVTAHSPHLNGQYTPFGEVIEGMEHVDAIKQGDPRANGAVADPDLMLSLRVADQ